ncbi:coenzyme F420 hydrogenase subunit beta [Methanoregula sp. UBA64]|jgi:coenzyme F420 hydrogenase subunit beta|uniref:coenzyme F420 hydrogenase subunit beta n=1 Tax=Methanoregula sp. UBA64 TaxID=1915554 RepID=UPI0025E9DEE9|nr:coenzyme F420 hydrogenase subunit beta [Methanoregula sp. UBA64]
MGAELGKYKSVVAARSADKEILKGAQDGGIVTSLFAYALDEGIIDGAIVAGSYEEDPNVESTASQNHHWRPKPIVATTKAELLAARGTKYNISPNVSLIKEATRSYGLDKVGIVGTPCQMQAVRKGQLYPFGWRDVESSIALAVGIFCMENFPYQSILQLVEDHAAMKLESVKKMEIGKGKFWVYGKRGQVVQLPLKVTHKYEQPGCHVCMDYVANLADISTGSVGSPDGWSTVFVRSKIGDSVWAKAMAAGVFETQPIEKVKPGLELVSKLANEKITKNKNTLEARKTFGVGKALRNPYI